MSEDPKLPEPPYVIHIEGLSQRLTAYGPSWSLPDGAHALITTAAAQAYAEALAAARVAQGRERCVAWIEARKDAFCAAHGYIDPDTGFLEFGRGEHAQAKHDYVSELEEIADGLRALSTQPPEECANWTLEFRRWREVEPETGK